MKRFMENKGTILQSKSTPAFNIEDSTGTNNRRPSSWAGKSELDAAPTRRPSEKRVKLNAAMCTCGKRRHEEEKYDTSDTCTSGEELTKNSRSPEVFRKTSFYFSCLRRKKTSDGKK